VDALVLASDENYARALAVAVHSALEHWTPAAAPEIYILDNGIGDASRARLDKVAQAHAAALRWRRVPPARLSHLESALPHASDPDSAHHVTTTTWSRLLVPELLPADVGRAVYLDNDVLVRRDLSPLFELDLDGALLAAVADFAMASMPHPLWGDSARPYFNSGVLVMDVDLWRHDRFADRVMAHAATQPRAFPFADQDALNAMTRDWYELSPEWNVQDGYLWRPALAESLARRRTALFEGAAVVHFTGASKPWHSDHASPATTLWARELRRSGWYTRIGSAVWFAGWLIRRLASRTARRARAFAHRVREA
jgi:lipopolysaccharide biosynthesis glycosyltransferase